METVLECQERIDELASCLETTKAELHDLATMGAVITSIHEIKAVLSVVMDMAIRLVDGEVGMIMLEDDQELKTRISWGINDKLARSLKYLDGKDLPTYCYKIRETVILNELNMRAESGLKIESIICLPIKTSTKCFGIMMIINKASKQNFTEKDKEILEMLLNFVAVAIDNSNMMDVMLLRQKTDQEMAIAKQIQSTILPQDIDSIDGIEIGVSYFPAREVGGDFYDVITIDEFRFVTIIGDVSNKGVPAALVMSAASGIIKAIISKDPDISVAMLAETTNDLLANEIIKDKEMFVTMFFCQYDLRTNILTYTNAGHMPGLLWDSQDRNIYELAEGGPIVGQFSGIKFKQGERRVNHGDRLFLYTDGLTEAHDVNNNLFGRERAEQVFSVEIGLSPKEFCLKVKEWVDRFAEGAGEETHDDFTILQIKVD